MRTEKDIINGDVDGNVSTWATPSALLRTGKSPIPQNFDDQIWINIGRQNGTAISFCSGFALIIVLLAVVIIMGLYLLSSTSIFEQHEQKKPLDENQRLIVKVKKTIANGEDINAEQNSFKSTLLHIACTKGDVDSVRLLVNNGANINCVDLVGNTPLHHTVIDNNLEIAQLLLDYSADVDFKKDGSGQTALHMAALLGRLEFVKLLIQYGANVNSKAHLGITPLSVAIEVLENEWIIEKNKISPDKQREVISILKKHGATEWEEH